MIVVTASDLKNNFGHYLDAALIDGEVLISRYDRIVARLVAVKNGQYIVDQRKSEKASKNDV